MAPGTSTDAATTETGAVCVTTGAARGAETGAGRAGAISGTTGAVADGSFVAALFVRAKLISPGLGMEELVSGWATRRFVNANRHPSPIITLDHDLPLLKDVKMTIS